MRAALLAGLILFAGCAVVKDQKANWEACKQEPSCVEQAEKWKDTGELVGALAGSVAPGVAAPASKVGGYASFAIAMLILGAGIRKKKESGNG